MRTKKTPAPKQDKTQKLIESLAMKIDRIRAKAFDAEVELLAAYSEEVREAARERANGGSE
jgi:hypothetical protein